MGGTDISHWPDPFQTELNNSLTSPVLQPSFNAVSLPNPPPVQNPVMRGGSGQRATMNQTSKVSLNAIDRKLNMSALDDIICFPAKHNAKNSFPLNSQNFHSKQGNLVNDSLSDLLR